MPIGGPEDHFSGISAGSQAMLEDLKRAGVTLDIPALNDPITQYVRDSRLTEPESSWQQPWKLACPRSLFSLGNLVGEARIKTFSDEFFNWATLHRAWWNLMCRYEALALAYMIDQYPSYDNLIMRDDIANHALGNTGVELTHGFYKGLRDAYLDRSDPLDSDRLQKLNICCGLGLDDDEIEYLGATLRSPAPDIFDLAYQFSDLHRHLRPHVRGTATRLMLPFFASRACPPLMISSILRRQPLEYVGALTAGSSQVWQSFWIDTLVKSFAFNLGLLDNIILSAKRFSMTFRTGRNTPARQKVAELLLLSGGLTTSTLAERVGISRAGLSYILKGFLSNACAQVISVRDSYRFIEPALLRSTQDI